VPGSRNEPLFHKALLSLEAGELKAAEDAFLELIQEGGETAYRPLAAVYLLQFSESHRQILEGSFLSLWEDFTFPGDQVPEGNTEAEGGKANPASETPEGAPPTQAEKTTEKSAPQTPDTKPEAATTPESAEIKPSTADQPAGDKPGDTKTDDAKPGDEDKPAASEEGVKE